MDNLNIPGYRVTVDGLNIHYKCLGKGLPVVLIHGGGNDWHEWKDNLVSISQNFQVYALDLPGFGLSQPPVALVSRSWSIDFIQHFLDGLGLNSVFMIGHSMGAMLSILRCSLSAIGRENGFN